MALFSTSQTVRSPLFAGAFALTGFAALMTAALWLLIAAVLRG